MLNIDLIRQHPDIVREGLRRRKDPQDIEAILRLIEQRRGLLTRCDGLYAALKPLHERARLLPEEQRADLNKRIKAISRDIRQLEVQCNDVDIQLQPLLLALPNIPQLDVPSGDDVQDEELRSWGEPLTFRFTPQPHWELSEQLQLTDFAAGVKIGGSRFIVLKGDGARLERSLITFMLDVHTREHSYTEILPPLLVKRSLLLGAGQFPKFEDQVYACTEDELYLNPTAEVPLVGLHSDSILPKGTLPLRYVAWTTAFRREAGSASQATRGLLRLHQFNKVELFQLVEPSQSADAFEQMVTHAERILQLLELPYRVVELHASNLPFAAARSVDLEVWMPSLERYVEISSISNCEAFQARRASIRYRTGTGGGSRSDFVHTLNGSGLAVGRTMAAILESYQQADGSVIIPKVLRPYMAKAVLLFSKS